ncbi:MAG TPA: Na+/H+ antiporter NhaA [Gemmatimonadales bacterium]|nr:Na+/H+ antiporter NhaA [Gemmatimonadales bacterium]
MSNPPQRGFVNILQEFSIPLLSGVVVAMLTANLAPGFYEHAIHWKPFGDLTLFGHELTLHFLVNEIFMVFFFGIAAKEITESVLPGGALNPPARAMNPLLSTFGGVLGPIVVFLTGLHLMVHFGAFGPNPDMAALHRGWGVPTATDIALAWLVARAVFGAGHPAVNFLLLLAVADDGIGLVIIALFYGDPLHPTRPEFLLLVLAGMAAAFAMRRMRMKHWLPYVALGGPLAWSGLTLAHLHPALALVFIVPFLPTPHRDMGLFVEQDEVDQMGEELAHAIHFEHSPMHLFEHHLKLFVDLGLFFFAFTQAGVELADIGPMTWLVLASLVIGKTTGITLFGLAARAMGFPLPDKMGTRELVMAGYVAALGLTVALFVATAAFLDPVLLGQGKMGALFSAFVGMSAVVIGRALGMAKPQD